MHISSFIINFKNFQMNLKYEFSQVPIHHFNTLSLNKNLNKNIFAFCENSLCYFKIYAYVSLYYIFYYNERGVNKINLIFFVIFLFEYLTLT